MFLDSVRHGIELHLHVDGSLRPTTLFRLAKKRGILLSTSDFKEFEDYLTLKLPEDLTAALAKFDFILSIINGDREAIAETTVDFLEDCAHMGDLCYVEARFSPHLYAGPQLDVDSVVKTMLEAIQLGSQRFNIETRLILCMLRHHPEWSSEVVQLAEKYGPHGVCGVDLAGSGMLCNESNTARETKRAFNEAYTKGIHRTVHVSGKGHAASVAEAINDLHAERIGHGYSILDNPKLYRDALDRNIHFEMCPSSSRFTGAVPLDWSKHPIHRFLEDGASVSISSDYSTLVGQWQQTEFRMCAKEMGLTPAQITMINFNAAKASFLKDNEKEELIEHMKTATGLHSIH